MAKQLLAKPRLYAEHLPRVARPAIETIASLPAVVRAFQAATGWTLRYVAGPESGRAAETRSSAPDTPGVGAPLGHLRLDPLDSGPAERTTRLDQQAAGSMASALSGMLEELLQTRHALWRREAELAAGVPVLAQPVEDEHFAARLEAVLKGGAEGVDAQAAALYLLDEATTELKLRACWGLPFDCFTEPARPLQSAVADLEALLGHAVVLSDADLMQQWNVPEDFPAAVCVPVSTPSALLGTLWIFCTRKREFSDRQTNLIEIVAGRLAVELERQTLLRETVSAVQWQQQLSAAERLQRQQLPTISPLLDGWQLAGWTAQADAVGGAFHDWFCLPDGLLAVAAGHAAIRGFDAAISAAALRTAIRSHAQYHREAQQALKKINLTLWTGSAGDQRATLFYGLVETATGRVSCAMAGRPGVVWLRPDGWQSLTETSAPLGESPEADYQQLGCELQPGEALVGFTDGGRDARNPENCSLSETGIAEALLPNLALSADRLVALLRDRLDAHTTESDRADRSVLIVKRARC